MTSSRKNDVVFVLLILSMLFAFSCKKAVVAAPPPPPASAPPPPPAPAPAITLRAQPDTINRGQNTTLQWDARNAATVQIQPDIGQVTATGNRQINPASSVTYTATATGPGGTATDTARITVNIPAAPPPAAAPRPPARPPDVSISELFRRNVQDIFFDYDKADIRPDQVSKLQTAVAWLRDNGNVRFTVEGHCDERGSEEYNLGLGDRRANAVKEFLVSQGVVGGRVNTVSFGEERPQCREQTEECYQKNRRAAFAMNQ